MGKIKLVDQEDAMMNKDITVNNYFRKTYLIEEKFLFIYFPAS